jgi:hypothetical protein
MSYMTNKTTAELRKIATDLEEVIDAAKRSQEEIAQILLDRHSKTFTDELAKAGKQDGEMTREIEGVKMTFAIKAKVKWDSQKLKHICENLPYETVDKVFKIEFSVPERTFKALTSPELIADLTTARTVEYGQPKIVFAK